MMDTADAASSPYIVIILRSYVLRVTGVNVAPALNCEFFAFLLFFPASNGKYTGEGGAARAFGTERS